MKKLYFIITLPFLGLSLFFKMFNFDKIKDDLILVISYIEKTSHVTIQTNLIKFLEAAEDHRYRMHYGVDFIAILRAIYVSYSRNEFQGASTIEQQLVRVITSRYEKTKWRKLREQILALLVHFYVCDKDKVAKSYLCIAFYGSGLDGLDNFLQRKNLELKKLSNADMLALVSRLKYPEPLGYSEKWYRRITDRSKYTLGRYNKYFE